MTMLDESCSDFINELVSKAPVPGGGGAATLRGTIGMTLSNRVGNLTIGKKKYADVDFTEAEPVVAKISSVPAGVGSVTTSVLCKQAIMACEIQNTK